MAVKKTTPRRPGNKPLRSHKPQSPGTRRGKKGQKVDFIFEEGTVFLFSARAIDRWGPRQNRRGMTKKQRRRVSDRKDHPLPQRGPHLFNFGELKNVYMIREGKRVSAHAQAKPGQKLTATKSRLTAIICPLAGYGLFTSRFDL